MHWYDCRYDSWSFARDAVENWKRELNEIYEETKVNGEEEE